jgi:SAM-dependent MidA family methyltransferase
MPVHRFTVQDNTFQEICVKLDNKNELNNQCCTGANFEICYTPKNAKSQSNIALQKELANLNEALLESVGALPWESGYQSEINLQIRPWFKAISSFLDTGVILLIDYGYPRAEYYHPQRNMGTLRCHMNHQVHDDPLYAPGLQDITAHVDFTNVAEAAVECDLDVLGYTNQAAFLLSCGLLELANADDDVADAQHLKKSVIQNAAIQQLTSPQTMGELFKVIALGHNYHFNLKGFELSDKRYTL